MYAYDYDIETGAVSNRRVFASARDMAGTFDGATVDSEGFIWSALVFGGRIPALRAGWNARSNSAGAGA
jgi:Gluconolactonase